MGRRGCKIEEEGWIVRRLMLCLWAKDSIWLDRSASAGLHQGDADFRKVTRARQKHSICIQSRMDHQQLLRLAGLHSPLGANKVFGALQLVGTLIDNGLYHTRRTEYLESNDSEGCSKQQTSAWPPLESRPGLETQ